jgi:hypothetical protein
MVPLLGEEEPIRWLWDERVPLGMVTYLEGAGSAGKTFVCLDMAARVTCGAPWPGRVQGPQPAGDVLLFCGDPGGWEQVILPRLMTAGADLSRICWCDVVKSWDPLVKDLQRADTLRRPSFPHDLVMLEHNIRLRPQTRLVVIDPLSAYCAKEKDYCETLRQLDEIAARRNVAIVVVERPKARHARLRPHEADRRADAVRSVFRVLVDPEDERLHHLAPVRTSFCAEPEWLPFQIGPRDAARRGLGQGMIAWGPPAETPPESALPPSPARERGALRKTVMEWLQGLLLTTDMRISEATSEARMLGYSAMTVRRAREALKVRMVREDGRANAPGWWTLRPPGWNGGDVPDKCPYDAATLAAIRNCEEAGETDDPEAREVKEKPAWSERTAAPRPRERDFADLPDAIWERLYAPLLAAILAAGRNEESPAPDRILEELPGANGKHRTNGRHGANGRPSSNGWKKPKLK